MPVKTDAAKVDVISWAKLLGEVFADGDGVVLDVDVSDRHIRGVREHLVKDLRLGSLGVQFEQVDRGELQPPEFGAEFSGGDVFAAEIVRPPVARLQGGSP